MHRACERCAMTRRDASIGCLVMLLALIAACAPASSDLPPEAAEERVVELVVTEDARFTPDRIEVQLGETIRFVVDNPTASDH